MGKTIPTISGLLHKEKSELGRFRRALRKEDQLAFDELWASVSQHLMACNVADHLLPLEIFLLTMLLEEHKALRQLKNRVQSLEQEYLRQENEFRFDDS